MKGPNIRHTLRSRTARLSIAALAVVALGATGVAVADSADAPPKSTKAIAAVDMQGVAGHGKKLTGQKVMQGGVTDGTYWYTIGRTKTDGQNTTTIVKSELWTDTVTQSKTYKPRGEKTNLLGHGNDIAYDSVNKRLIVPAWDNDDSVMEPDQAKTARIVDPETLEVTGDQKLPGSASAICYDPSQDRYIGGSGMGTLWTADAEFNELSSGDSGFDGIGQGIDCDGDYVYVLRTPDPELGQKGSHIYVLDWELNLVTTYGYQLDSAKPDEVEHLTHRSGTFYLGFNDATGDLCRLGKFSFAVSYKPGEGTGSMERQTVLYGIPTKLRENTFTREGYTFAGWSAYRTSDESVRYQNPDKPDETKWAPEGEQPSGWVPFIYGDNVEVWQTTQRGGVHLTAQWEQA